MLANVIPVVGADPTWFLLSGPLSVIVAVAGLWLLGRPERKRRERSDARLHGAVFGYTEGNTKYDGIVDIVRGNGKGNVLQIAERSEESVKRVERKQREIGVDVNAARAEAKTAATAASLAANKASEAAEVATTAIATLTDHIETDNDRFTELDRQVAERRTSES